MRIQKVRFKNLNSLAGEWEIDLNHPAFAADGIFAITGPTGSGKTTILDAICLALYGRTPRLNKVNKSSNEIMSRQSGECFAEVYFETQTESQTRRFVCHWSQHRARKKADGELQNPKHEISNADSGEILENKLNSVAQKIIQISGMDFERFTRSMLLAQGGFAAFLQAAADERAPILEQITGTEIYSQISIKVHQCRSDEQKKLDTFEAEMSGMQLLTKEDESLLQTTLKEKIIKEEKLLKQYKQANESVNWRLLIDGYEKQGLILEQKQQQTQERWEAFQPQQKQLAAARQALELGGDYARLSAVRKEQKIDQQRFDEHQILLPESELQLEENKQLVNADSEILEQKKIQQKQGLKSIRHMRELDLKIKEKEKPIKRAGDKLIEIEKRVQESRKKLVQDSQALEIKKLKYNELSVYIKSNAKDENLVEQLTGINKQFNTLRELHHHYRNKEKELRDSEGKIIKDQDAYKKQGIVLDAMKKDLKDLQTRYNDENTAFKLLLEHKEISDWRNECSQYKERQGVLDDIITLHESVTALKVEDETFAERLVKLIEDEQLINTGIENVIPEIKVIEREINLLEENLTLQNKIKALDKERKNLKDDEPCPLCGAKEHPYAIGNLPAVNKTIQQLKEAKSRLAARNNSLSNLKISLAEVKKEREQINQQKNTLLEKINNKGSEFKTMLVELSSAMTENNLSDEKMIDNLQRLKQENNKNIKNSSMTLKSIETAEKQTISSLNLLNKTKENLADLELKSKTAEHIKLSSEQTVQRLKMEFSQQKQLYENVLKNIHNELSLYDINNVSLEQVDEIEQLLQARRNKWVKNTKEKNEVEQQINHLNIEQLHHSDLKEKAELELKDQHEIINELTCIADNLLNERKELFADKNPDQEEEKLLSELEYAEKKMNTSRHNYETAALQLLKIKTNIEVLEKDITKRDKQLNNEEKSFKTRLKLLYFNDEEQFNAAYLSEQQRNSLIQQEKLLITEQTELAVKMQNNKRQLDLELEKNLSDRTIEELKIDYEIFEKELKQLQGELGAVKQKLQDNDELRITQQSRAERIDKQKKECSRWNLLHDLIGSADGKKYRNFAQGLTFEMMVSHANQQLQKMTQRYLLIRDEHQPLELNVMDSFQAGEIRSTKNLSGGESFIVSLSLALGLSQMASKKVRVDSLFLDEGFGTLDEEALDTALETLSGLQQDGKLIGVISHVQALKERISTQIVVSPYNGGRSVISGQGCSRL